MQPIELVWAVIKEKVNAQYSITETTDIKQVLTRLDEACAALQPATVWGCIKRAMQYEDVVRVRLAQEEEQELARTAALAGVADNDECESESSSEEEDEEGDDVDD